ncbi:Bug family tripartite tricarboxylate transporter substrate binding protein [Roseomonas sp. BN140053]|uniref:Bug family tripartite tricarboxylate transporter substrate binding protein n=1 Tax=Roseomonas sp. BN140053 TaxID=3391898 RepID=UPI0039E7DB0D
MAERTLTRRAGLMLGLGAATGLRATGATAQARNVARVVVPYAPGGTTDVTGRLIANPAAEGLGQTWVIENRSGANGAIGAGEVARAAPDGSTLLYSNEVHILLKYVQRGVPFDSLADFTPVLRTVRIPYVLVGGPAMPQTEVRAVIDALKREPGRYSFAGSTLGSVGQIGAAALGQKLGAEFTIVAYRGTAPAVNDVISGAVAVMIAPLGAVQPLIAGGQLKAYAVTARARVAILPDVPTMTEIGFPEMVFDGWTAIWGPKGLPAGRMAEIHRAVSATLRDPAVVQRLTDLGCEPIAESSADFARFQVAEQARNAAIIEAAGIRPE